jgi:hypothetical protein
MRSSRLQRCLVVQQSCKGQNSVVSHHQGLLINYLAVDKLHQRLHCLRGQVSEGQEQRQQLRNQSVEQFAWVVEQRLEICDDEGLKLTFEIGVFEDGFADSHQYSHSYFLFPLPVLARKDRSAVFDQSHDFWLPVKSQSGCDHGDQVQGGPPDGKTSQVVLPPHILNLIS